VHYRDSLPFQNYDIPYLRQGEGIDSWPLPAHSQAHLPQRFFHLTRPGLKSQLFLKLQIAAIDSNTNVNLDQDYLKIQIRILAHVFGNQKIYK
jgi:hypothetical protein